MGVTYGICRVRLVATHDPGSRHPAPNLNLIERVWRFLKQKLACHRFWADVDGLETAAGTLLDRIDAHFHATTPPSIRLVKDLCETA